MSLRTQFVALARLDGANIRQLCRRFAISPQTGYKWLKRFEEGGAPALKDRSRRPHQSPGQTLESIEQLILKQRDKHPAWGPRKLRRVLLDQGHENLPAPSTITAILRRHQRHDPGGQRPQRDLMRFEREAPNQLWQIDFKGHFPTDQGPCHPLTMIDDHSRYAPGLRACADEKAATVQAQLTRVFAIYGLPEVILADNGGPWSRPNEDCPVTRLGIWFWRLGIALRNGRPYPPQTQGKIERFHKTLKAEVLTQPHWRDLAHCQQSFDRWLEVYNHQRPHQSLNDQTPATRYRPSSREMPAQLPPIAYDSGVLTRRVSRGGALSYRGQFYYVGRAFAGFDIGLLPTATEGVYDVHFGWKKIARIDRSQASESPNKPISIWPQKNPYLRES